MKAVIKQFKLGMYNILPWQFKGIIFRLATSAVGHSGRFRKSRVGKNTYVDPSVQIIGWENVTIGNNTTISEDSWLNVNYRDASTSRIVIGNNCHIGRRNFLSSGPLIKINDYGFTGLDCQFLGCGHDIESPLTPYIASGLSAGGIIEIGVNCWLATGVTVMQDVKIGCGSVVGAKSLVLHDLPPFCIAVGSPCKVIKRFDFKNNRWIKVCEWSDNFDKFIPSEQEYLGMLVEGFRAIPPSLVSSSSRFGWL